MSRVSRSVTGLPLLIAVFATHALLVDAEQPGPCIFGHVPDQTVWLKGTLTIKFNATNGCEVITMFRNGQSVLFFPTFSDGMHIFHVIQSITEEFNNATMTLQGRDNSSEHRLLNSTEFKVYTVDNVSAVTNLSFTNNCTHTTVGWPSPSSQGLKVTDFFYVLRLNDTIVESGVKVDPCVVFNLTTLPANEPGSLSVWARAPPGNGTVTNTSIVAALAPNVSYGSVEVVISSQKQKAILVFVGVIDQSCPASHPTGANISFSCLLDEHSVQPVINGTTVGIHSNAIDTGYTDCNVTVTSINLSGENTSQSFMFSSTDVQQLVATPSNNTGAIDLWIKLASNSSLQEIVVNIFNSHGVLVNSTTAYRSLQQRVATATTKILPIDWYTVSALSCYNKSLTINETVNITRSNYTPSPSPSPTPSPSPSSSPTPFHPTTPVPSSTGIPNPTNNNLGIIIGVPVGAVVIGLTVIIVIVSIFLCLRKHRKGSINFASRSRSRPRTSSHRRSSRPVQAEAGRHDNENSAMVSSVGGLTRPLAISSGEFTSSLPSSPAEQYLSTQQEASTPDMHLLISNNSLLATPAGSEIVTSQTTTFTENSTVNSDQPLIGPSHSSYTPPPSLPAVHAVPQRPVEETTTTADSEQHLLPSERNELGYQSEGLQESRR